MAKYINTYTDISFKEFFVKEQYWGMKSAIDTAVEEAVEIAVKNVIIEITKKVVEIAVKNVMIEITKKAILEGLDNDLIVRLTGLSIEQIEKIRKNNK